MHSNVNPSANHAPRRFMRFSYLWKCRSTPEISITEPSSLPLTIDRLALTPEARVRSKAKRQSPARSLPHRRLFGQC